LALFGDDQQRGIVSMRIVHVSIQTLFMTYATWKVKHCFVAVASIAAVVSIASCRKSAGSNQPVELVPRITSFIPESAAKDSIIIINGENFSTSLAGNTVKINGETAAIIKAGPTRLEVKVPVHAGDGDIVVSVGTKNATATNKFKYLYTVSTLAGDGTRGFRNGAGNVAQFQDAFGLKVDRLGNIFVADGSNNRIRKITPAGIVSTVAGNGNIGMVNGPADNAQFNYPHGLAIDAVGNIYVADAGNNMIRKITPAGVVSTVAGNGNAGYVNGAGNVAEFFFPADITIDNNGNLYVADGANRRIRKIAPDGTVSSFGDAVFGFPEQLAIDPQNNLYVADAGSHVIRKMTPGAVTSIVAGTSILGYEDGPAASAKFINPEGVAIDVFGNLFVGDLGNAAIRRITPAGVVSTIAGGVRGFAEGVPPNAKFFEPSGVAVDLHGNVYVADVLNSRIRILQ
jgi:sugar lactone lactonase YvrE